MDVLIKRINRNIVPSEESIKRIDVRAVEIKYIGVGNIDVYIEREGCGFNKICTLFNKVNHNNCFSIKCGSKEEYFENSVEFFQRYEEYLEKTNGSGFANELVGVSIVFREEEESEYNGIDLNVIFRSR